MRIFRILPLALVCLVGCGGPSLVGKWSTTTPQGTSTMEFTSTTFKQSNDGAVQGTKMHSEASGTYTFDGKKVKMTVTDLQLPDQLKALVPPDAMKKIKDTPIDLDVKLEGDKLTITPDSATNPAAASAGGTFTRVK